MIKKEGQKSENKGFFFSDFRRWRLRFSVCERNELNGRNIKNENNREIENAKINSFSFTAFLSSGRCFRLDVSL